MSNNREGTLTLHSPGSVREAWSLIFPIALTAASSGLMIFFDRLILAQYSTLAMAAAASAGMVVLTFHFSLSSLTAITEVFVGQYNGSRNHQKVGESVWQMLWLSVAASLIFVPVAFLAGPFFVADGYEYFGVPYFKWLMVFGSFGAAQAAFAGFFVGIGNPKIVTMAAILGNVLNLVLDIVFVFGVEGWIPSMGTMGAALATGISMVVQMLFLGVVFFNQKNRKKYHSGKWHFKWSLMKHCLHIGSPTSLSHAVELGAWSVQMNLMAQISEMHIVVMAIGQSMLMLFMFATEGLSKGLGSMASNYMGAKRLDMVPQCLRSTLKIHVLFIAIVGLVLVAYPMPFLEGFIEGDYTPKALSTLMYYSRWALLWVWLYMLVDGVAWILSGILTAAGDTKIPMLINGINAWAIGVIPLYIMMSLDALSPSTAWFFVVCYGAVNTLFFLWRYKAGSWKINRIQAH